MFGGNSFRALADLNLYRREAAASTSLAQHYDGLIITRPAKPRQLGSACATPVTGGLGRSRNGRSAHVFEA